jgi:hypothetical protein
MTGNRTSIAGPSAHSLTVTPSVLSSQLFLHVQLLTYSMQQSPFWEANKFLPSQGIPHVLLNPKVHYCIHKYPPPVSILSQPNTVHNPKSHFLKIYSNIILLSTPGSPQLSLSLRFPHQNPIHSPLLSHPRYTPRPSHSSWFYHPCNIWWGVQNMKLLVMKFSPFPCYVQAQLIAVMLTIHCLLTVIM